MAKSTLDIRILSALWIVPLAIYTGLIGQWSLSGDEYYTLVDSSKPVAELLSYERKPLYYLICHLLLSLDLPISVETVIRIPAAIAASLIAPTYYLLLSTKKTTKLALFAAMIALANPWLFQMSQFARFYSLAFLFASISVLSGFRWIMDRSKVRWIWCFLIAGGFAGLSHTPAAIVVPAGAIAMVLAWIRVDPANAIGFLRKHTAGLLGGMVALAAIGFFVLKDVLGLWLSSDGGAFGDYSSTQILVALAIFGGISGWALALVPLLKMPTSWSYRDIYLVFALGFSSLPLLALVSLGGGVAARYLLFCLPGMFLLAAQHWSEIDSRLPNIGYRSALALALLSFNLPYLASVLTNADHFDYRAVARTISNMEMENPVIVASAHELLNYYLERHHAEIEMMTIEGGLPKERIQAGIDQANAEQRTLLLVSREDRTELSEADQDWLYGRFALVKTFHKPRYDHRRNRMAIYQYRPDSNLTLTAECDATSKQVDEPDLSMAP